MDGQDYLNQISASNRPVKSGGLAASILTPKVLIIGGICIGAIILMMIVGAILSNGKVDEKSLSYTLMLHLNNTEDVINSYQNDVKSSNLRASAASLKGILGNTSKDLSNFLAEKYAFKEKEADKKIAEQAKLEKDGLVSELFQAKINGALDRVFAHKMAYEISILMTEENKLISNSKSESLKNLLTSSYNSLLNLYDKFNDFSETK